VLGLIPERSEPPRVLVVGCHADDIEIGCGGTMLELVARNPDAEVTWLVLSGNDARATEASASASSFLDGLTTEPRILVEGFRDGFLPYLGPVVKERFEALKGEVAPDLILTHTRDDLHQDHRLACELTWNTFRNHLILEYEIPKWDGDLRPTNIFVPLDEASAQRKVELLLEHFASQRDRHWFTSDVFLGLMRLRGLECNASSGYAEGFHGRKVAVRP
jgi:LmbE family N-acetylglucosaminyl deacetylase